LQDVVDEPSGARGEGASEGTDDSGGDGVAEAERIANGDGDLADGDFVRIGEPEMVQVGQVDTQDGEVGAGVIADDEGARLAAVGRLRDDLVRTVNDVAVGHDESVRRDEEARAGASPALLFGVGLDMHDGGAGLADGRGDGVRISVKQLPI